MESSEFKIVFHVGVHKTATSHLQKSLKRSAEQLTEHGVRYYGPWDFRLPGRTLDRLFQLKPGKVVNRSPRDQLEILRKGASRLLISEENYIGVLNSPRRRAVRMRYPEAARRVSALAHAMEFDDLEVAICIRNPADFLNSAYFQLLYSGRIMTAARFKEINPFSSVNWGSLVKRLCRAKGVSRVTLWRYEDYEALFPQICAALVGSDASAHVVPLGRRVQEGLSLKAVSNVLEHDPKTAPKNLAIELRKQYPIGHEFPRFDGFDATERAMASTQYEQQWDRIRAIPGITILEP